MEVEYIRISAETLYIFNSFNFQLLSLIVVSRSAIFNYKSSICNSEFSTFKAKPSILFRLPIFVTLLVSFIIISKFVLTMLSQEIKAKKLSRGKAQATDD